VGINKDDTLIVQPPAVRCAKMARSLDRLLAFWKFAALSMWMLLLIMLIRPLLAELAWVESWRWRDWEITVWLTLLFQVVAAITVGVMLRQGRSPGDEQDRIAIAWLIGFLAFLGLSGPLLALAWQPVTLGLSVWLAVALQRTGQTKLTWITLAGINSALIGIATWVPRALSDL
jgi:hypothetical protein